MLDFLSVTRVQLKKVLSTLGDALDSRAYGDENSGFVLGATHDDARDFVDVGLRRLEALHEFTLLVLPVLERLLVSDHDWSKSRASELDGGSRS